jgi:hypothetical protein
VSASFCTSCRRKFSSWDARLSIASARAALAMSQRDRQHKLRIVGSRGRAIRKSGRRDSGPNWPVPIRRWPMSRWRFRASSQTGGSVRGREPACQRGPRPLGRSTVAAKQTAKSLINDDFAFGRRIAVLRLDQVVAESLMRSLFVIMRDVARKRAPQVAITKPDHLAQALALHGADKSFRR